MEDAGEDDGNYVAGVVLVGEGGKDGDGGDGGEDGEDGEEDEEEVNEGGKRQRERVRKLKLALLIVIWRRLYLREWASANDDKLTMMG